MGILRNTLIFSAATNEVERGKLHRIAFWIIITKLSKSNAKFLFCVKNFTVIKLKLEDIVTRLLIDGYLLSPLFVMSTFDLYNGLFLWSFYVVST
ncbi:hypothetical protein J2T12_003535 [Paenibacillus anaericanus]|nr:hypothetical protein [Paenibacillus anaericanus]